MAAAQLFVLPAQLEIIRKELGSDLCRVSELLATKLRAMPKGKDTPSREYAELREAKALFASLKYPDTAESLSLDDLAWALKRIHAAYEAEADPLLSQLLGRLAQMLDVDLNVGHPIPLELDRRISNELTIISRYIPVAPVLKEAV
jgi:hypothetical protein